MADLGLPDTVDTTETLFKTVGVPRQIIVDHQMRPLEVDTFACRVSSDENADILVLLEQLFDLAPLVAEHTTVDVHHRILAAKQGSDFIRQVTERVAVFGEYDEFLPHALRAEHIAVVLEEFGEFVPLAVFAALTHVVRHTLQFFQCGDFSL